MSQYSAPSTPQDLVGHNCINMRQTTFGGLYAWEFEKDGREVRVRVEGQLTFNTSIAMIDAAIAGYGIAFVPDDLLSNHVAEGRLTLLLEEWCPRFAGYHLYYPSRRQMSAALRVVIDALRRKS